MTCQILDPQIAKYDTTLYIHKHGLLEQVVFGRSGNTLVVGGVTLEFDNDRQRYYLPDLHPGVTHFRRGCKEPHTHNLPVLHGDLLVIESTSTTITIQFNFEPMPNKRAELAERPGTLLESANGTKDTEAARMMFGRLLRDQVPIFWWNKNNIVETLALHPTFRGSSVMAGVMAGICHDSNGTMREYAVLQTERREGYGSLREFLGLLIERREVQGEQMAFVVDCSKVTQENDPPRFEDEDFGVVVDPKTTSIPDPYDPKPGDVWVFRTGARCVVYACEEAIKCWVEEQVVHRPREVFAGWLHANQPQERYRILLTRP